MNNLNLIIDDDPINNTFCKFIITKVGLEGNFQSFTNPEEGLQFVTTLLSEKSYSKVILFLDINMPVMNGWDFLKELEKIYKNDPEFNIYILSSSISEQDKSQADANKLVRNFISKPLSAPILEKIKNEIY